MKNFFEAYRNPLSVVLVIILAGGIFSYQALKTSLFPEITFPKIKVIADAGLQPVDKMMVTVTRPLENAIKKVPGLKLLRSTTSRGNCEISAFMEWNVDVNLSLQQVESQLARIQNALPPDISLSVEKMNPSILPVSGYTVVSHALSPIELKQLATYTIKPFLSQVEGVAEIRISGGKEKEYWVEPDPQKMSALSITPQMLSAALGESNFIRSNGYLSDYHYLYLTITDESLRNKEDLENLIVSNVGNRIVRLRDLAVVDIKPGVEYTRINANGHEALLVAVVMQPEANLIDLSQAMQSKIVEIRKLLPPEVSIQPYYVQADFVNDSIQSVSDSLIVGLILAIVVAILFLRSLKASVVILATIPITLCLTFIVLYAIGYSLNIMTLGAIAAAIGLIIDDAIVVVEQIHRTHEEHPNEPSVSLMHKAISYLFPAMLGSSISTIVIFVPFVLMSGVAGAYFKVMTDTMIVTLVCSFFVTWLGLPVIYLLLSKKGGKIASKALHVHNVKAQKWVGYFVRRPIASYIIVICLFAIAVVVVPNLETGFLPEMDEGSIVLDYTSPPGTSLQETDRMLKESEKLIMQVPEVQSYSRRTGTEMGFFITEPNSGDYLIQLKKDRNRSTEEVISDIRGRIEASQPALTIDFGQVIGDMLGDLMSSTQPVEIKVFGEDKKKLATLSKTIADIVETIPGTADVFDGIVIAGPSINIRPNNERLSLYGISPAEFQYQFQTALEGNTVGDLFEEQQLSPIRIVYPGARQFDISKISTLPVILPTGKSVPMGSLADVKISSGEAQLQRENLQSVGVITARLEQRDLGSVMADIQREIGRKVQLPLGYHIQYGGAYAEQQQSFKELLLILVTSSLLVFGVILFLFKDFRIAFLILTISVLGIAGSYLALYITQTPLNVGSYTGIIMIVGIIGENAIFTFLQFKESRGERDVDEAITYSISTRLRPKLMTAIGAITALLPLALGIGAGAQLHQPLAIAVIGGFLAALPLLLIVLPTMIKRFYHSSR